MAVDTYWRQYKLVAQLVHKLEKTGEMENRMGPDKLRSFGKEEHIWWKCFGIPVPLTPGEATDTPKLQKWRDEVNAYVERNGKFNDQKITQVVDLGGLRECMGGVVGIERGKDVKIG